MMVLEHAPCLSVFVSLLLLLLVVVVVVVVVLWLLFQYTELIL